MQQQIQVIRLFLIPSTSFKLEHITNTPVLISLFISATDEKSTVLARRATLIFHALMCQEV